MRQNLLVENMRRLHEQKTRIKSAVHKRARFTLYNSARATINRRPIAHTLAAIGGLRKERSAAKMKAKGTPVDYAGRKGIVVGQFGYDGTNLSYCNEVLFFDTLTLEPVHPSRLLEIPKEELRAARAASTAYNNCSAPVCPDCGKSDRIGDSVKYYCMRCARSF
jgi:hypothetical protein